jgi:carboxyl-terminal processing protease
MVFRFFTPILAFVAVNAIGAESRAFSSAEVSAAVQLLEMAHYARANVTSETFAAVVPDLMEELDPEHAIFLQGDVKALATELGPKIYAEVRYKGNIRCCAAVFERWRQRWAERGARIQSWAATPPKLPDVFEPRRARSQWPASTEEADVYWAGFWASEINRERLSGQSPAAAVETVISRYTAIAKNCTLRSENDQSELTLSVVARLYDPHSRYFSAEAMAESSVAGSKYVGIGAIIVVRGLSCTLTNLIPGWPCFAAGGLHDGDQLVAVTVKEGATPEEMRGMTEGQAVDRLRGAPNTILRIGTEPRFAVAEPIRKVTAVVRGKPDAASGRATAGLFAVEGRPIGVISVRSLYRIPSPDQDDEINVTSDVRALLKALQKQSVAGLVLDLRHNTGGYLDQAVDLTSLLVGSKPILQVKDYTGAVSVDSGRYDTPIFTGLVVVLVDEHTASGAEIIAGALQNCGRAVIVGTPQTAGNGSIQQVVDLREVAPALREHGARTGAMKFTIQQFYLPDGTTTQQRGLRPDIVISGLEDATMRSERSLRHALPPDSIRPAAHRGDPMNPQRLNALRAASEQRQKSLPELQWLKRRSTLLNAPVVWPTNYDRWRDLIKEEADQRDALRKEAIDFRKTGYAYEELAAPGVRPHDPTVTDPNESAPSIYPDEYLSYGRFDPALREAERILVDLVEETKH